MPHGNKNRKQTPEQIRKRVESVARTKAAWTSERHDEFVNKVREANKKRDPDMQRRFTHCHIGKPAWNKGKTCPQYSGPNHWNWGNKIPQESIEKMRKSLTGKKQSPELVKKRFDARAGYRHSEDTKAKIGMANKGDNNGMFNKTGVLNPAWRGGISFEPYPTTWTFALREMIRNRDERKCLACGKPENGKRHDVHHIDYDKKNIAPDNLITLCVNCHRKTNYKRDQWRAFFEEQRDGLKTATNH